MVKRNEKEFRSGSKRHMISEMAERGLTKREAFAELRPLTEAQIRPMIFSANVGGARRPKPMAEQLIELKNEIGRVYAIMGRSVSNDFDSDDISPDSDTDDAADFEPTTDDVEPTEIEEEEKSEKPVASGKQRVKNELKFFLSEVRRIRKLCEDREATGSFLDWISMRPVQAASNLIPAGIPAAALLHSMTLHWKPEIRREAGIPDFDFVALSRQIMTEREIDPAGKHELFGYVLVLAENGQPIMLIGPAGTGKSHLAHQIAEFLNVEYGETPMTSGATRGDLLGRMTANPNKPFVLSLFAEIYGNGGVFNFEEIDAADPGMLIVLNNALASSRFFNSANGELYLKSDNFMAFATANTFGTGSNSQYTGREKLDAATIDRWRMGRCIIQMDESIEEEILFNRL